MLRHQKVLEFLGETTSAKYLGLYSNSEILLKGKDKDRDIEELLQYKNSRMFDAVSRAITPKDGAAICSSVYKQDNTIFYSSNNITDMVSKLQKLIGKNLKILTSDKISEDEALKSLDNILTYSIYAEYIKDFNNHITDKKNIYSKLVRKLQNSDKESYAKAQEIVDHIVKFKIILSPKDNIENYLNSIETINNNLNDFLRDMFFSNDKIAGDAATISKILMYFRPLQDILKLRLFLDSNLTLQALTIEEIFKLAHGEVKIAGGVDKDHPDHKGYIGISKYTCLLCNVFLDDYDFIFRGWHNTYYYDKDYVHVSMNNRQIRNNTELFDSTHSFKKDRYFQEHELSEDEEVKDLNNNIKAQESSLAIIKKLQDIYLSVNKFCNSLTKANYFLWYNIYKNQGDNYQLVKIKDDQSSAAQNIDDQFLANQLSVFQKKQLVGSGFLTV